MVGALNKKNLINSDFIGVFRNFGINLNVFIDVFITQSNIYDGAVFCERLCSKYASDLLFLILIFSEAATAGVLLKKELLKIL